MKDYTGKKAAVIGIARSGVGAANLLKRAGADVTILDNKQSHELLDYIGMLDEGVKIKTGGYSPELLKCCDMIIISPGVSLDSLNGLNGKKAGVIGELELAYRHIRDAAPVAEFIGITGTNGKTTTTTLLGEIVKESGTGCIVGGNIGNAMTMEAIGLTGERVRDLRCIVLEVSSFQLETIIEFKPKVSAILNITPDHLDRYNGMKGYADAKCRIFEHQDKNDYLILNADDPYRRYIESKIGADGPKVLYFSSSGSADGASYRDGRIHFDITGDRVYTLDKSDYLLKGIHNVENIMAAGLAALSFGIDFEAVREVLKRFGGLAHRVEFVAEYNGVRYFDDSKGTNIGAVQKAIEGLDGPVILIAGGRDKDSDFTLLSGIVKERVKGLVLIGEAAQKISNSLGDYVDTYREETLRDAVERAAMIADSGDVVLLSPGCASFDMFKDYADRGRQFTELVREMIG